MKKYSKLIALLLVAVLAFSLAGCGKTNEQAPSTSATEAPKAADSTKSFLVGTNCWGAGVPVLDYQLAYRTGSLETFGCTVTSASDDFTADKELQNGQNFVSAGVNGICFQGGAPNVIPIIADLCKENKIPFTIDSQVGGDDILNPIAADNEFYLGAVEADYIFQGEQLAQAAYDDGCRKAIIVGGNIGDVNMDKCQQGFTQVFEKLGGKVVGVGRCTDQSECATKVEDLLSANRDADCIYMMVGDYVAGTRSATQNLGVSPNLYVSCTDADSAQLIKEGVITCGNDGFLLSCMVAPTILMNYLLYGNKFLDENGHAKHYLVPGFIINKDNADKYIEVFYTPGSYPVSNALLKNLVREDITEKEFKDTVYSLDLATLAEWQKK